MKQMEDFVLIFEVEPKWNNSKCKRWLGWEQEKLKQGVANILTDFKGSKTFIRMNSSDTIYMGNLRSIKKC